MHSKKGVAMAIETVVFIILAVLVLTILLFFFTSQSGPAQQQITMQRERNEICGRIATKDPKCEDFSGIEGVDKLKAICGPSPSGLGICTASQDTKLCIQNCCIFCPKPLPVTPKT